MHRWAVEITAIISSYSMSFLSFVEFQNINFVSIITAMAGAILTLSIAWKNYEQTKGIRLDNEIKRKTLNDAR